MLLKSRYHVCFVFSPKYKTLKAKIQAESYLDGQFKKISFSGQDPAQQLDVSKEEKEDALEHSRTIDRMALLIFPIILIIFNVVYWNI